MSGAGETLDPEQIKTAIEEELKKASPDWHRIEQWSRARVESDPDNVRFTVDAGHIQRLGAELVGKQDTALSELIKNAYDADATKVVLTFTDYQQPGGTLVIEDDGSGMQDGSVLMSGVNLHGGVAATVGLRKLEVTTPSPITERHHDDRGQDGID